MSPKTKDELLEDYEDAYFSLLMNEYVEEEGNRLLQEFQEADARGEVPELPQEANERVLKLISDGARMGRRRTLLRKVGHCVTHVLIVLLACLGLTATLVLSVDALRNPVVTFILEDFGEYSTLVVQTNPSETQPTQETIYKEPATGELLEPLVPYGFELIHKYSSMDGRLWTYAFQDPETDFTIVFDCTPDYHSPNYDTENAKVEAIEISGYGGYMIEKIESDGLQRYIIILHDPASARYYTLITNGLDSNEVWKIATRMAGWIEYGII